MKKTNSFLTLERIQEIEKEMSFDWDQWRLECDRIWKNNHNNKFNKNIDCSTPHWTNFATTNPIKDHVGIRGCVAFHKIPCSYKRQTNGRGCTHCGLTIDDKDLSIVFPAEQIEAVKRGILKITQELGKTPPVLEILPDGSFLNEKEVSKKTQEGIIKLIAKNKEIIKVAFETRTKFISAKRIKHFLEVLRKDQVLEIYIGLESMDDFVLNQIIKKGFTVQQCLQNINNLAKNLSIEEKKRLHFSFYHLFKPPYLTEKESIESAIFMAKQIKDFEKQIGIKFSIKYEPAVISRGTFQKFLYDKKKYSPPNYFSNAEIIASSYYYNFKDSIKFGQRDDLDNYSRVAAVPSLSYPNMLSPFDFMVYNAVHRFNNDQDIWGFCADLSLVINNSKEFIKWENEVYGDSKKSFLSNLFSFYQKENWSERYLKRIEFQKRIWKILDQLEYNAQEDFNIFSESDSFLKIIEKTRSLFSESKIKILKINKIKYFESIYQFEVIIENECGLPQSLWVAIPVNPVTINLENFNFIYN